MVKCDGFCVGCSHPGHGCERCDRCDVNGERHILSLSHTVWTSYSVSSHTCHWINGGAELMGQAGSVHKLSVMDA